MTAALGAPFPEYTYPLSWSRREGTRGWRGWGTYQELLGDTVQHLVVAFRGLALLRRNVHCEARFLEYGVGYGRFGWVMAIVGH